MLFNQLKGNPCLILLSAEIESGAGKYGARAWRFACLEAGHLAEALLREAALAGFGCCPIGGFDDHAFEEIVTSIDGLNLPLYIIAVGLKA